MAQKQQKQENSDLAAIMEIARKEVEAELISRFGADKMQEYRAMFKRKLPVIKIEDKIALLRPIGAEEIAQFSMLMVTESLNAACRYIMQELWLDGDTIILDDEEYFMAAMLQVQKIAEVKKSTFYLV
ncbi:MAG: hypothetical protein RBS07_15780 [Lentimicrobium sp.]|jgi:hypothetical protein|nr:hypothetical protein [Lentimicrobium sp.]